MRFKIGLALIAAGVCLLFVFEGRWMNPADETKEILGLVVTISELEDQFLHKQGRYGNLSELASTANAPLIGTSSGCGAHYCITVAGASSDYRMTIYPNPETTPRRRMSAFADRSGTVRVRYGQPYADESTPPLTAVQVARLLGRK